MMPKSSLCSSFELRHCLSLQYVWNKIPLNSMNIKRVSAQNAFTLLIVWKTAYQNKMKVEITISGKIYLYRIFWIRVTLNNTKVSVEWNMKDHCR